MQKKLLACLAVTLFVFSFIGTVKAQNDTSIWRDDVNYSNYNQFQTAGWSSLYPTGISFSGTAILLDGTQGDNTITYQNKFPSGIYNWKIEAQAKWTSGSHSGINIGAVTEKHTYHFMADGWYTGFAFYRDSQLILRVGSYQEISNEMITLRMEKHGNQIDMYFNNQLQNSYTETDTTPSQLNGYTTNSPWQGGAEFQYFQAWSSSPIVKAPQTGDVDSWTMFGHDAASARYSTSSAPRTNQLLWSILFDSEIRTSVTISGNNAYVGSFSGSIYALDASTGVGIWRFKTGGAVWSTPAVANGIVYVGSDDFVVYALSAATGSEIWTFRTGGEIWSSSPAVLGNVVYIGSTDNNIYALDANSGVKIWNFTTGGQIRDTPAVVNGVVYVGSQDGNFYALNAATGSLLWSSPTGGGFAPISSSPAVVNGVIFVGSTDNNLYALRASDGSKVWSFATGGMVISSPAVFNDVVYVGSEDGSIYAVDALAGTQIWSQATGGPVYSSPAIANGVVYVGSWLDTVYAFDALTGRSVWDYRTGSGIVSSPSISGGVVFIGSYDAKVYAFGSSFSPGATSSPSNSPVPSNGDITNTAWVPTTANGAAASIFAITAVSIAALIFAAASSAPGATSGILGKLIDKIRELIPDTIKKWLEDFVASKRKLKVDEKTGSPYLPTKSEAIVYGLSILFSTLAFSYVKVSNLDQILMIIPTFFATSILVSFARTYILAVYTRRKGVWTEYKLWPFGLGLFLLSTLAFRTPFSSPTRTVRHSKNFTPKLAGFLSVAAIFITLGFGALFFVFYKSGFALIGGTGLAMCLISAFFDTFPFKPMGGNDVYKYNKPLWAILFVATLGLYCLWIAQII